MACIGISSSWDFCCLASMLRAGVPLGSDLPKRKPCEFVGSIWGNTRPTPFPIRLISQISMVYSTCLGTKWAEEEKSPSIPRNAFLLMSRYLLAVSLKKIKAILTIVISLKNVLHWNLVKSALDKEDKSVPVYSPLFNFLFVVSVCNVFG